MKCFPVLVFLICIACPASAQQDTVVTDTAYTVQLKKFVVTARWKNDTDRYRYNQMKYYVTTILPYLNAATQLFSEIDKKVNEPGVSKREKRQYINAREDEMRNRFEDKVRTLNVTQGVLLVKLIARQTDLNIYAMLQEFKNPFTAIKWQAWAKLNGLNLNRKYRPEEERDLENIMDELGYPLPAAYAANKM